MLGTNWSPSSCSEFFLQLFVLSAAKASLYLLINLFLYPLLLYHQDGFLYPSPCFLPSLSCQSLPSSHSHLLPSDPFCPITEDVDILLPLTISLPSLSVHHSLNTSSYCPWPLFHGFLFSRANSKHSCKKQKTQEFVLLSRYLNLILDTILIWCFLHIISILQWRAIFSSSGKKPWISFQNCGDFLWYFNELGMMNEKKNPLLLE